MTLERVRRGCFRLAPLLGRDKSWPVRPYFFRSAFGMSAATRA
jgi:hypothetical protein